MNILVKIDNDQVVTTSEQVAFVFGKRHSDVLRDIRRLLEKTGLDFGNKNFHHKFKIKYLGNTQRKTPYYTITKNGFILLTMGYTGDKPIGFKLAYINYINQFGLKIPQGLTHEPT